MWIPKICLIFSKEELANASKDVSALTLDRGILKERNFFPIAWKKWKYKKKLNTKRRKMKKQKI
jgi:hypothetical protein